MKPMAFARMQLAEMYFQRAVECLSGAHTRVRPVLEAFRAILEAVRALSIELHDEGWGSLEPPLASIGLATCARALGDTGDQALEFYVPTVKEHAMEFIVCDSDNRAPLPPGAAAKRVLQAGHLLLHIGERLDYDHGSRPGLEEAWLTWAETFSVRIDPTLTDSEKSGIVEQFSEDELPARHRATCMFEAVIEDALAEIASTNPEELLAARAAAEGNPEALRAATLRSERYLRAWQIEERLGSRKPGRPQEEGSDIVPLVS